VIAVAFGIALRGVKQKSVTNVQELVEVAYQVLLTVLHWIIHLVPIGVLPRRQGRRDRRLLNRSRRWGRSSSRSWWRSFCRPCGT